MGLSVYEARKSSNGKNNTKWWKHDNNKNQCWPIPKTKQTNKQNHNGCLGRVTGEKTNFRTYRKIYLMQLKIFMLIINQRNTYFFVKFYEKSEHIAKSNSYCTYSSTYTHIYIYRPKKKKSTNKLILSLDPLFSFLSKNSCLRRFITFQVCNVGYLKQRHSMSKSFCWLWPCLSYVSF